MISDGIMITPINAADPYRVLGMGQYNGWWDIGYICSNEHGRINIWSRYKPVALPAEVVNGTFNNSYKKWDDVPYTGSEKWGNNPWFYGSMYRKTYTVPVISSLSDIGEDGVQKETAKWTYNPPVGGDSSPFRLDDFLGYNHLAQAPLNAWMSSEIKINNRFLASISDTGTDSYNGEFEFHEILKFAFNSQPVYAGIAIRNRTRNILTGFVKKEQLGVENSSGDFSLDPSSGDLIENGGFSQILRANDTVDVYLFLSYSPGDTDPAGTSKLSAYLDSSCICYKRFIVGYQYRNIIINYTFTNITIDIIENRTLYINDYDFDGNGSIYKISKFISGIYGNYTIKKTSLSDYRNYSMITQGTAKGRTTSGRVFDVSACPTIPYFTRNTPGNFNNSDVRGVLNGSEELTFIGYNSYQEAQSQTNPISLNGLPIYDSIEYNGDEYDNVGTISNRVIKLHFTGFSSLDYTSIYFESTDNNNILFQD